MKAQISVEFITILSIFMIIFLVVFVTIDKRNTMLISDRKRLSAKSIADKLSSSINQVFLSGHGAKKTIYLPDELIGDVGYNLTVHPTAHVVEVTWNSSDRRQYTSPIVTSDIAVVNLSAGQRNITNNNGVVEIG